jgi:ribonuclease HI
MYLNRERLDIRWIRSHQGEPLNEGADALARLASRYVKGDSELSAAAYRERAGGLASAFAAEFRRRAAEAETVLLSA